MGDKASATPELLYAYSRDMTLRCDDLVKFVGRVADDIATFEKGATKYGQGIFSGYNRVTALLNSALSRVKETDSDVYTVGSLFDVAGREGKLPPPVGTASFGLTTHAVTTTDGELEQAAMRYGAEFANKLQSKPWSINELPLSDNPYFVAGLLNALTPEQLQRMQWDPGTTRAMLLALKHGLLTNDAKKALAQDILRWNSNGGNGRDVLNVIASDPAAAAAFVRLLKENPDLFKKYIEGDGWNDTLYKNVPVEMRAQFQRAFFNLLAKAVPNLTIEDTKWVTKFVGENLPKLNQADTAVSLLPDIKVFLGESLKKIIGPLPPASDEDQAAMADWVREYGAAFDNIKPYLDWLAKTLENSEAWNSAIPDFISGWTVGLITDRLETTPFSDQGLAPITDAAEDKFKGLLTPSGPDADPADLDAWLRKSALLTLLLKLSTEGRLTKNGAKVNPLELLYDPDLAGALNKFGKNEWPKDSETDPSVQWADKFRIGTEPLETRITQLGARILYRSPEEIKKMNEKKD